MFWVCMCLSSANWGWWCTRVLAFELSDLHGILGFWFLRLLPTVIVTCTKVSNQWSSGLKSTQGFYLRKQKPWVDFSQLYHFSNQNPWLDCSLINGLRNPGLTAAYFMASETLAWLSFALLLTLHDLCACDYQKFQTNDTTHSECYTSILLSHCSTSRKTEVGLQA